MPKSFTTKECRNMMIRFRAVKSHPHVTANAGVPLRLPYNAGGPQAGDRERLSRLPLLNDLGQRRRYGCCSGSHANSGSRRRGRHWDIYPKVLQLRGHGDPSDGESACRRDSVRLPGEPVAIHLSGLPGSVPSQGLGQAPVSHACSEWGLPSRWSSSLVRSYRTISPLPVRADAVSFLWHCPAGRPTGR